MSERAIKDLKENIRDEEREFNGYVRDLSRHLSASSGNVGSTPRRVIITDTRNYLKRLEKCDENLRDYESKLNKLLR